MQPYESTNTENPSYLVVWRPDAEPFEVALEDNNSLFAGSGSNCRVVLRGADVEPIHCMFWMGEESIVRVQDWNTRIGIKINGQPASAETILNSGDEVKIGENRVVLVLCPDVHQRVSVQLRKNDELLQPMTDHSSGENLCADNFNSAEKNLDMAADHITTDSFSVPVSDDSGFESFEPAEPETRGFEYDVMADLDSVDVADGESPNEFGDQVSGSRTSLEFNESREEEIEMLQMEVDQLRFELAQRDASQDSSEGKINSEELTQSGDDQTIQLVNRLEQLLEELKDSDDRVRGLEDMLRASDQATQAERDERLQLESWVTEIEQRVAERESESEAELSLVRSQLEESKSRHKQTQIQLKKIVQSRQIASGEDSKDLIPKFSEQVEDLETRLENATREINQLRQQVKSNQKEVQSSEALREMEQQLVQQQVDTARERADMSRQRAELESIKGELEEKLRTAKNLGGADDRVRAMRQHLREIHEEEKTKRDEKRQRSLGGRISRLLGATDR